MNFESGTTFGKKRFPEEANDKYIIELEEKRLEQENPQYLAEIEKEKLEPKNPKETNKFESFINSIKVVHLQLTRLIQS